MIEDKNYLDKSWFNIGMYEPKVIKWLETHDPPFVISHPEISKEGIEHITVCLRLPVIDKNCIGHGGHLIEFIVDWRKIETKVLGQTGASAYCQRYPVKWNNGKPLAIFKDELFVEQQCLQLALELYQGWKDKAPTQ